MREIREVYKRASAFHVHLLKCQFERNGIDHSDSEKEDNESMISGISPTPALEPLLCGTEKEARSFYDCAKSAMLEHCENSSGDPLVTFTLDSASDIHVIQLKEAIKYFSEKSDSNLKVLGVSGNVTRADLQGHLVIVVEDGNGNKHNIDLGIAQGMGQVPVNLLSVSLLLRSGCIVHLEENHCYLQLQKEGPQIDIRCNNGMFEIDALPEYGEGKGPSSQHSCSVNGTSLAAFGNLMLWHRRLAHISKERLVGINRNGSVDGFKLKGHNVVNAKCDTCSQAKILRNAVPSERKFSDPANHIGHTVSSDVKLVPFATFRGMRYAVTYVDHHTLLGMVFFVRTKAEISGTLDRYLREMKALGVTVKNIQTDRGSEYFSQEGDLIEDRDRNLHKFGEICLAYSVRHIIQPVEMKEKVAENSFRYLFRAVNAMLWEARLSPAFWEDACAYAQYLWNRTPNSHTGDDTTPWTMLTGQRARWDKFKVFGCDVWQHIPNNPYYKVPGLPRGRRMIFVGIDSNFGGWKVFNPERRSYEHSGNLYFNEDFSNRIDALRHHDTRRAMMHADLEQPIQLDDFDDPNASAVRNLYLRPDAPAPAADDSHGGADASPGVLRGGAAASAVTDLHGGDADAGGDDHANDGPIPGVTAAGQIRGLVKDNVILRPLRLMPVGTNITLRDADKRFISYSLGNDLPIVFQQPCPKKRLTPSRDRYLMYMQATTLREALSLGALMNDIKWDYAHGFIKFPTHESVLPGHVFMAYELAGECGFNHVLHDYGFVPRDANVYTTSSSQSNSFNELIKELFPKEEIVPELRSRVASIQWAEYEFAKVLNASSLKIDFDLPPEPFHYKDTLPENCGEESVKWKEAMDDEIASMKAFGVYERVPQSVAQGRQILGCKWVYKRKTGKDGEVTRYRARLVAQGFRQREWDSFNPDEISSPVAHKDTLRLFLSTAAGLNLRVQRFCRATYQRKFI